MNERGRGFVYAAITAALATKHPKRHAVARALEALVREGVPVDEPFPIDPNILKCYTCGRSLRVLYCKPDDEGDNWPDTVQVWPDGAWVQDCLGCGYIIRSTDEVPNG